MLLATLALAATVAQPVEIRSRHFRVTSTLGPATAIAAALRLERSFAQLEALGFPPALSPTEVIIGNDLPIGRAVGVFQQGPDASFIAVQWAATGDPLRALAHEFAHQAMAPVAARQPMWLREGLAELLSNLEAAGGGLKLGAPIAAHIDEAKLGLWLTWPQVLAAAREAAVSTPMFYAQSWLAAHRGLVGRAGGTLAERIARLDGALPADTRMPESLPAEIIPATVREPEQAVSSRPLDPWEYEHRRAELLRATHHSSQAREALEALRAAHPGRPEPVESLGALEMDAFEYDTAEERLAEAVRLGSRNPSTHYRYSLLLMRPAHPEPERARRAAEHAARAVEGNPEQPLYWLARAHAEMQLAKWQAARVSLDEMRRRAQDPLLREQVRVELEEIERRQDQARRPPPTPQRPEKPPPIVEPVAEAASISPPPATTPAQRQERHPGTLTFWGYLRRVECGAEEKILTVSNRVFAIRVRERAGAPAKLHYPPQKWRAIPCTLQNVEVNVVYRPSPQLGPVNGDVVAVIF